MKINFVVALAATGTLSLGAVAEEQPAKNATVAPSGLEEVVVTATKRAENLQVVPVAVDAVTAADLTKQGVFETSDLNHAMPNLQVSSPYGKQQPNFSVRGIGVGTEYNANAASPVGVYVDEVYQTFRASHGQQLYDLEQIEVVRGPQGTLYGRNTTGGAINFNTRQPKLQGTNGELTLGFGNFSRKTATGAIEFTPVPGKLGIRLAATYEDSDPYIHNVLPAGLSTAAAGGASGLNHNTGISPGGTQSHAFRGTVRFQPNDAVDISLKGYLAKAEGGVEVPIPTGQSKTSDVIDYTSPTFLLGALFQQLAPAGLLPASYSQSGNGLNERQIQSDSAGTALTEARGGVLTGRFTLSDHLKLVSVTGFDSGRYAQTPNTDCDGTPLALCTIGYDSKFHAFNQDLRVDYSAGAVKLIVGAFYGTDSITTNNSPNFFNFLRDVDAALGLPPTYFNPGGAFSGTLLPAGSLPTGITATQHFRQDRKSAAIYSEGSYQFTDRFKLTAGLRYTSDKNDINDGLTTYFDDSGAPRLITVSASDAPYIIGLSPGAAPGPLVRHGKSSKMSGRIILDYKLADAVMGYVSVARGYRAGTYNGLAYGKTQQVYYVQPETVDAFEIGLKSRFLENRLQVNAAIFHDKYKGQQGQVVDASATANLISLDGKVDGLEVSTEFAATDNLRLNAAVGLLHSKYDDATCPPTPLTGFPAQAGNCVQSAAGSVSVGGNPFPYAAKSSVNLGVDWDAWHSGAAKLTAHADAAYTGKFYYDSFKDYSRAPLQNVATGKFTEGEGEYWVLNGRLSYGNDRYTVAAWGKNLTDKTYYPFGISIENLFGNGYRVRAEPRTFGLEVGMKF